MKEFKKILILPFAITAMLFLGALTTSASNVSDVKEASIVANPVDYVGDVFIPHATIPNTYIKIGETEEGCTLDEAVTRCLYFDETSSSDVQTWGIVPGTTNVYKPLYTMPLNM